MAWLDTINGVTQVVGNLAENASGIVNKIDSLTDSIKDTKKDESKPKNATALPAPAIAPAPDYTKLYIIGGVIVAGLVIFLIVRK